MEKAVVAAMLTLFVVLMALDVVPMITAEKPLFVPKTRLVPINATTGDVQTLTCPGGETCADDNTCCMHTSGRYACCQKFGANCCFDYTTCCDSGYVCDDANNGCVKAGPSEDVWEKLLPFLKK